MVSAYTLKGISSVIAAIIVEVVSNDSSDLILLRFKEVVILGLILIIIMSLISGNMGILK